MASPGHSIDISASSPTQLWRAKPKQEEEEEEEEELEDGDEEKEEGVEMLLPGPAVAGMEKKHRRWWSCVGRVWKGLVVVLWVVGALVAVAGWVLYWAAVPGTRLLGDINGLVPNFPVRPVVFEDDLLTTSDHKTAESANATYEYWVSFMPVGNGFMKVEPDDGDTLAPPMISEETGSHFFSIAVFHQLHCLHKLMKSYNKLSGDLYLAKRGLLDDRAEEVHHPVLKRHADHCFRYLRQTIVCCADTALEGQDPRAPTVDADGTGATHLCKDFEMVKAWAEDRRMDDSHWI